MRERDRLILKKIIKYCEDINITKKNTVNSQAKTSEVVSLRFFCVCLKISPHPIRVLLFLLFNKKSAGDFFY